MNSRLVLSLLALSLLLSHSTFAARLLHDDHDHDDHPSEHDPVDDPNCVNCIPGVAHDTCQNLTSCHVDPVCYGCDLEEGDYRRRCPEPERCESDDHLECAQCVYPDCLEECLECEACVAGMPKESCPFPELCGLPTCLACDKTNDPDDDVMIDYCPYKELCPEECQDDASAEVCMPPFTNCAMARPHADCPFPELATVMGESRPLLCYDCLKGDGGHDDGGHDHMMGDMDMMHDDHDHDDHDHDHDDEPSGPSTELNLCIDLDMCHHMVDEMCLACTLDDPDHCPDVEACFPSCMNCQSAPGNRLCSMPTLCAMANAAADDMDHDMMHMMMMYFHFSIEEIVLFEWWNVASPGAYVATIVAIAALSMLREWLVNYRKRLTQRMRTGKRSIEEFSKIRQPLTDDGLDFVPSKFHTTQDAALYFINLGLGYLLMLVFMTYNAGLCLTVLFASTAGHLYFSRPDLEFDPADHCAGE